MCVCAVCVGDDVVAVDRVRYIAFKVRGSKRAQVQVNYFSTFRASYSTLNLPILH